MTQMTQDRGFLKVSIHYAHGIDICDDASGQQSELSGKCHRITRTHDAVQQRPDAISVKEWANAFDGEDSRQIVNQK